MGTSKAGKPERKLDEVLRRGISEYAETQNRVRQSQAKQGDEGKVRQNSLSKLNLPYRSAPTLDLAKQLEINPKLLREKLPKFAEQLKRAPDATSYERANAAYVVKDYSEAERLACRRPMKL